MPSSFSRHVTIRLPLVAAAAVLIGALSAQAAEKPSGDASDQAAIRATADAFVKAFNRGDAQAVAALWTPNGSMVNDRGQTFKGRQAIADEYAAFFKQQPGSKDGSRRPGRRVSRPRRGH